VTKIKDGKSEQFRWISQLKENSYQYPRLNFDPCLIKYKITRVTIFIIRLLRNSSKFRKKSRTSLCILCQVTRVCRFQTWTNFTLSNPRFYKTRKRMWFRGDKRFLTAYYRSEIRIMMTIVGWTSAQNRFKKEDMRV